MVVVSRGLATKVPLCTTKVDPRGGLVTVELVTLDELGLGLCQPDEASSVSRS